MHEQVQEQGEQTHELSGALDTDHRNDGNIAQGNRNPAVDDLAGAQHRGVPDAKPSSRSTRSKRREMQRGRSRIGAMPSLNPPPIPFPRTSRVQSSQAEDELASRQVSSSPSLHPIGKDDSDKEDEIPPTVPALNLRSSCPKSHHAAAQDSSQANIATAYQIPPLSAPSAENGQSSIAIVSDAVSKNSPADIQASPANEATVARSVCTTPDSDIDLHQRVSPSPDDMKADPSDTQLDLASIPPEIELECLQPTTVVPQRKPTIRTPEREFAGFSIDTPIKLDNALETRAMIEQSRSVACCPSSNLATEKISAPRSSWVSTLAPELGASGIELTSDDNLALSTFSPCTIACQTANQPALLSLCRH